MLKTDLNSEFPDEPRTLCSDVLSCGIPICEPSHLSSASLASYPLQISESPTRGFLTKGDISQSKMLGQQALRMNTNLPQVNVSRKSFPSDASDLPPSTDHAGSASNTVADARGGGKEERLVSKEERDGRAKQPEHKRLPATEDLRVSPPPTDVSSEPSYVASFHEENKPPCSRASDTASSPPPELVAPPLVASSEALSSLTFYSFVVLHVPEDQEEAGRVCAILNNLKIGEGTTFCEGFETAGVSPLQCLADAVENSAYIVLLLTSGFLSKWGQFQANAVLMNSIEDVSKSDTVIPFVTKFKAPAGKIPLAIKSLTRLDENVKFFPKHVKQTFKKEKIERQRARWKREQDSRALQRQLEDTRDLAEHLQQQQRLGIDLSDLLSRLLPHLIPPTTVIQISNSSYVQIGDQNLMSVQQDTNVPQMGMAGERGQECDQENQR
ncbi:TIR domain-containing adapter molecule 1 [Eleutherodactylus coqui]|uniref:TIR domain-containing adapter molecule 1 n=1 Tax=Eleutherodactylus coqui TaxID=57060 RepID=UPI0034624718